MGQGGKAEEWSGKGRSLGAQSITLASLSQDAVVRSKCSPRPFQKVPQVDNSESYPSHMEE